MAKRSKYTTYAPPSSDKTTMMKKLFGRSADKTKLPPQVTEGDPAKVEEKLVAIALQHLTPASQTGDLQHFPTPVNMQFGNSPQLSDVKWDKEGDPANPYTPDIRSPGNPDLSGRDSNPEISAADVKPNYVPGSDSTKSPSESAQTIVTNTGLNKDIKLGSSGGNEFGT